MSRSARRWLVLAFVGFAVVVASIAHGQSNKFRLKPGAEGKVCLGCHTEFAAKLKSKFVHTPVKDGDCTGCHSPHAANHGKLLSASTSAVCLGCHQGLVPDKAASTHKVVIEGGCVKCHDPHASNNKANLLKAGNELCAGCHKRVGDAVAKVKFGHRPVADSCLNCHNPHASEKGRHLLKASVPTLCVQCHKTDRPSFAQQHLNYPVATANCVSCHEPHGSNTAGILYDTVHPPVAAKRCSQCHNPPGGPNPFATRRAGFELCRGCHSAMINEAFGKAEVHWPLVAKRACLNCHSPHASRQKKLLSVDEASLCGQCHGDTVSWQKKLADKAQQQKAAAKGRVEKGGFTHDPVQQGDCTTCHSPHGADGQFLMRRPIIDTCGTCHDWLKHNSHPMGEKVAEPRNKNRFVNCLSCHRSHGTGNRFMLTFQTSTELCVQCHKKLGK